MNVYYIAGFPIGDALYHYGIPKMEWHKRRFQNYDGSLTDEGYERYYGHPRLAKRNVEISDTGTGNAKAGAEAGRIKMSRKSTAKDVNDIYSTLSADEKMKLVYGKTPAKEYTNDEEYNSSDRLQSFMLKYGDVPVSAFDIWSEGDGNVDVSVMTRSGDEYRGKGYARKVVEKGMNWIDKNPDILTAYWDVRKDNAASIALAKKYGFKQMDGEGSDPAWTTYHKVYKR